jgi:hypothetical protein
MQVVTQFSWIAHAFAIIFGVSDEYKILRSMASFDHEFLMRRHPWSAAIVPSNVFGTLALAADEAGKRRVGPIRIDAEGDVAGIEDIMIIEYTFPSSSLRGII